MRVSTDIADNHRRVDIHQMLVESAFEEHVTGRSEEIVEKLE